MSLIVCHLNSTLWNSKDKAGYIRSHQKVSNRTFKFLYLLETFKKIHLLKFFITFKTFQKSMFRGFTFENYKNIKNLKSQKLTALNNVKVKHYNFHI
jgi:hypothetical protein